MRTLTALLETAYSNFLLSGDATSHHGVPPPHCAIKTKQKNPPKLLTFSSLLYYMECPQAFPSLLYFSFCAMISTQQPRFPNKIQRVMDCQTEEEACEEQYDSENCTCSSTCASSTAESNSGLIHFKYCYGMLALHSFIFLSLEIVNVTVTFHFEVYFSTSPPLSH